MMQIDRYLIDFRDHVVTTVDGAVFLGCSALPEAMRSISSRKATQVADSSCLAREITATCQGGMVVSNSSRAMDDGLRSSRNSCDGISVT